MTNPLSFPFSDSIALKQRCPKSINPARLFIEVSRQRLRKTLNVISLDTLLLKSF
jgi:hypothetical protein